jgi:hypothetical protein
LTAKVVVAALPAFVLSATNRQYQAPIPLLSFSVFLCIPLYLCNNFFFILLVEFTSIVLQSNISSSIFHSLSSNFSWMQPV